MSPSFPVQVACYSGYTYAQEPRAIHWLGRRYEIARILKRWRTPGGPAFRVEIPGLKPQWADAPDRPAGAGQAENIGLLDLVYLESEDTWTASFWT